MAQAESAYTAVSEKVGTADAVDTADKTMQIGSKKKMGAAAKADSLGFDNQSKIENAVHPSDPQVEEIHLNMAVHNKEPCRAEDSTNKESLKAGSIQMAQNIASVPMELVRRSSSNMNWTWVKSMTLWTDQ